MMSSSNLKIEDGRLLIVKMSSIGDILHGYPVAFYLKKHFDVQIDWVVNASYVPLVKCFPAVDRVIGFPRKHFLKNAASFMQELRATHYDAALDLQGLLKSAWVTRRARASRYIGPSFCREGAQLFFRELAGMNDKERHAVEECLDVIEYLGVDRSGAVPPIVFPASTEEVTHPSVALVPASRWPAKNWPVSHFVELIRNLNQKGPCRFYILGGPVEKEICNQIANETDVPVINLAGQTSLLEMGSLLQQVDLLISVDSGPVHMAAAAHTPVLGLYGVTDPLRTGPYGDMHRVLTAPGFEHRPRDFKNSSEEVMAYMQAITPECVAEAAIEMLDSET